MSHSEKCPVCDGRGTVDKEYKEYQPCKPRDCHGCNGKGWVEVSSDRVDDPVLAWPVYSPVPIITIGPWVHESGIYSANVEVHIEGL